MAEITLTIDDKIVKASEGDTILKACEKNGFKIPTLCHFEGLTDIGSCRMCIVEIHGPRGATIDTACTKQATDGMVIKTNTDRLKEMRKATLELLFAEGNHFCMYCVASGNCELQDLAYMFGIDHVRWVARHPRREIDASHKYLVMDRDRCVLCYRCVRACEEMVGNNTLAIYGRGFRAKIIADFNKPWGKSSCISAGACLQVCPTGAISDRHIAYTGRREQLRRIKSSCLFCSVGCGTELVVRDNHVIKIEGDWSAIPNKGLLCAAGRFEPLYEERRKRLKQPLVKRNGKFEETNWDDTLNILAGKLKNLDKAEVGALITTRATNETMKFFSDFFRGMGVENLGCLEGYISFPPEDQGNIADLDEADMFIVVGTDLTKDHQVVGFFVKRGTSKRWSWLIVVDQEETGLVALANQWLRPDQISEAIRLSVASTKPVVIYGNRAGEELSVLRRELSGRAKFLWMAPGTNSLMASSVGLNGKFNPQKARFVYVLAADAGKPAESIMTQLKNADFVVVQSSYAEPWTEVADYILPTVTWAEKEGTITNLENRTLKVSKAIQPPAGVKTETGILEAFKEILR